MDNVIGKYIEFVVVSVLFGVGQFLMKVKQNKIKKNLFDFSSELLFAVLASYIALQIAQEFNFSRNVTLIVIGISSWMGSKFLDVLQKIMTEYIAKKFGIDELKVDSEEVESVEKNEVK